MRLDPGRIFALAWRWGPRAPEPLVRALMAAVADVAWATRGDGVRQLERNLRRVRPDLDDAAVRRLARAGMRSYMRYYGEVFHLPALGPEHLRARFRLVGDAPLRELLAEGRAVPLALSHSGNWDLAGAWAQFYLGRVLTVAEKLEPAQVFAEFLAFREGLGMSIIPLGKGGNGGVFRELLRRSRQASRPGGGLVVPLLADRDLSHRGVEVDLGGHRARVAAGPAALAVALDAPLFGLTMHYERLHGARRQAAGSPWGVVGKVTEPLRAPAGLGAKEAVAWLTQAWVERMAAEIAAHPQDWHMLQKVFVEDLDPERLARAREAAGAAAPGGHEEGGG